jgi:NTE family protein
MTQTEAFAPEGLFGLLQDAALRQLPQVRVARGDVLIAEGSSADAMYLVETGRFRVEREGVTLAEIGAGSVIGEIAFLTGQTRTASVIAARDAVIYAITHADYEALCADHPALVSAIATELANRLAATSARVPPDPGRPPARTFCIVPAAGAPLPDQFAQRLSDAISTHRKVTVIDEAKFRAAVGTGADPASPEAITWLNAQERTAEILLFVANPEADAWSNAALRQADQALLVAQSVNFAGPSELETLALQLMPESQRRLVLLHPIRTQHAKGTARWLDSRPSFMHHHVALTAGDEDVARLARFIAGRAVGLVLSGGGAFGMAHVGVWRAMEEAGLPIDMVGGTSVGSAMGGAIALGLPASEIGPRVESIFVKSGAMRRVTVPKYAFLDHKVLDAALLEHYGAEPIEDLWLPYYAVVADLSTMKKKVLRRGPLWEAIRASSAIPGILPAFFTPEGEMYVDGGCIDNLPFRDMHGFKTGPNVVVNVQKETGQKVHVDYAALPGRAELVKRAMMPFGKKSPRAPGVISTVMRGLLMGQGEISAGLNADDFHIRPPGLKGAGFLAWSQHKLFYEISYKYAAEIFSGIATSDDPALIALRRAAGIGG